MSMMMKFRPVTLAMAVLCVGLVAVACGPSGTPAPGNSGGTTTDSANPANPANPNGQPPAAAKDPFVLAESPKPAEGEEIAGVLEVKSRILDENEKPVVVVEGRVKDLTNGYYAFTLIDKSKEYCGQVREEDDCVIPWDYCCVKKEERNAATMFVQFVDGAGKPAKLTGSREYRQLDLIRVVGTLSEDESGNLILTATGYYRVERPTLGDHVKWESN